MSYANRERQREYQRAWMARRRAGIVAELGGKCAVCGSTEDLEVDHIDRSTKVSHRIAAWSPERRAAELSKCQLLCRAHHHEKTGRENRRDIVPDVGTGGSAQVVGQRA